MKWRPIDSAPVHKSIILATQFSDDTSSHTFMGSGYLDWDRVTWRWDSDEPLEPKHKKPTHWMPYPDPPYRGNTESL